MPACGSCRRSVQARASPQRWSRGVPPRRERLRRRREHSDHEWNGKRHRHRDPARQPRASPAECLDDRTERHRLARAARTERPTHARSEDRSCAQLLSARRGLEHRSHGAQTTGDPRPGGLLRDAERRRNLRVRTLLHDAQSQRVTLLRLRGSSTARSPRRAEYPAPRAPRSNRCRPRGRPAPGCPAGAPPAARRGRFGDNG